MNQLSKDIISILADLYADQLGMVVVRKEKTNEKANV